jgi:membrane protein DedA with SNARE-associated domain/membrane-associated phospholipid phosphatase
MTLEYFQPVLDWMGLHPTWAGFIVFLISLIESLAIIGLIIPGTPVMFAIGMMMGTGHLPMWETMSWAVFGAVVGDGISYWLGYRFHEQLRKYWPFRQFPKILAHGETFFKNHGGKSIILGRFGPVRPVIPVIAGMMDMKPKNFFFFNVVSAFVWAPAYTLPGILVGLSVGGLSPEVAKRAIMLALLLVLALWLIYMFLRTIGSWITALIQKGLSVLWRAWQASHSLPWLHRAFKTSQGTEEGQFGLALLFLFALVGYIFTLTEVYYGTSIIEWNEPVYQVLRALYSEKIIAWVAFITELGNPWVLLPPVAAVGLWLCWCQRYKAMFCWLLTIGGGFLIGYYTKIFTAIPRPEGLVYLFEALSFPSGHALTATLTYGLTAAFLHLTISPKHRWIAWTISILLILTIAISRIYIGVHWFTDIIGSLTLGITCVALGTLIYRRLEPKPISLQAILIPGLSVLCLTFTLYTSTTYQQVRKELVRQWPTEVLDQSSWWSRHGADHELYRTGAFKRQATLFDVQWLGPLQSIQETLEKTGWHIVPKLDFKTGAQFLVNNPSPMLFPVMPKFHRDRLPVLTVAKSISDTKRLVLQLWNSDYLTNKQTPLWVGTLRLEEASHPLPLMTVYLESNYRGNILKQLRHSLRANSTLHFRTVTTKHFHAQPHTVLLIRPSLLAH